MSELFDQFDELGLPQVAEIQKHILDSTEIVNVVKLGSCDYFHAFHADCINNHFNATSNGNEFYKCAVCSKIYGVRVGTMPQGIMTWKLEPNTMIGGSTQKGAIVINYSMPSGTQANG